MYYIGRRKYATQLNHMARPRPSGKTLYLGYPCSVDAGVDPVKNLNHYRTYSQEVQNRLHKFLCGILNVSESINHDELITKAQELRDRWGYTTAEDRTMMLKDVEVVEEYIKNMLVPPNTQFIRHSLNHFLKVINEVDNERITDINGFLTSVEHTVKFLYLSGHGLSESVASALANCSADDMTNIWPWKLCRCKETMGKTPFQITTQAQKGDIVVFSSGFLTPEWVFDRIKDSERHKNVTQSSL